MEDIKTFEQFSADLLYEKYNTPSSKYRIYDRVYINDKQDDIFNDEKYAISILDSDIKLDNRYIIYRDMMNHLI